MIDIHSHFLPNMDDGAKNVGESIAMLSESKKQGVDICVGTSHVSLHSESSISSFLKKRAESIELLENAIKDKNADVPKLMYGAEIFLDNDISQNEELHKLSFGDRKCLLVELSPMGYYPLYTEWLYSLTLNGYLPIIAHIERYPYMDDLFAELESLDIVYQMNAKTVLGLFGPRKLLSVYEKNKKIIVASDMHNMGKRKCCLQEAKKKIMKKNPDVAEDVFFDLQKEILNIEY